MDAIPIHVEGMSNFYQVTPNLFRSARPTGDGFNRLPAFKTPEGKRIKTVLNLQLLHEDPKIHPIQRRWVKCEALFMSRWKIATCLDIITNPENQPILVHCLHGADRTGTVIAAYRISIEGWTTRKAIEEMVNGGFNFHYRYYQNLVNLIEDWEYNQ